MESASAAQSGRGIDAGLAEIFEEFREAAEEEPVSNEDYETHYNMGTAYKEMELIDEAIQVSNGGKSGETWGRQLTLSSVLQHAWALFCTQRHATRGDTLVQKGT